MPQARRGRPKGSSGKAAVLFLEKGNLLEAAKQFGAAGMWDRAGEYFEKSGYPLKAAEAYEKKGDVDHAIEHARIGTHLREVQYGLQHTEIIPRHGIDIRIFGQLTCRHAFTQKAR